MPEPQPTERLRISSRSAVIAVVLLGATLAALRMIEASTRVIGWVLVAIAVASLLHPLVSWLTRLVPRAVAVILVALVVVGGVGLVGYSLVHSVVTQTRHLQDAAPSAAVKLEHSKRYGDLARDFKLVERTRRFVDSVPQRLQGGSPAEALRAAATRGVAFLATGVLTLFFLLYGPALAGGAARQIQDPERRRRLERIVGRAYDRTVRYATGTVLMALAAGLLGYLVAMTADVPGAAPLGMWMGLWDIVPLVGATVGSLPIVILAAVSSPSRAIVAILVFVAWQVFEQVFMQRRVERASIHLGPFATVIGGLIGIELYGLGGALITVLVLCMAVAVADEALPD